MTKNVNHNNRYFVNYAMGIETLDVFAKRDFYHTLPTFTSLLPRFTCTLSI